ncbi:MAG: hypothetical protein QW279_15015 [Candidatus Jordarchaeaceae archaeon]
MSQIDNILLLLLDDKWHNFTEIACTLKITHQKLGKVIKFLKEFSFIQYEKTRIRISSDIKELIEWLEGQSDIHRINSTVFL